MKKSLIALVGIICIVSMMFGCAAEETTTATKTATTTATETATSTETTTSTKTETATEIIKPIELKFSHASPPTTEKERVMQEWADMVEEKSGGRVKITMYWGGSLVSAIDAREAVEDGMVDIAYSAYHEVASRNPLTMIMGAPLMPYKNSYVATAVWHELLDTYAPIQKEHDSVKTLWSAVTWARRMNTIDKVVRVPDDLKGLKLLAFGESAKALDLMGATTVQLPPPDWYTSLDRGLVEGIATACEHVAGDKLDELVNCHLFGNITFGLPSLAIIMNWDVWNSLPADVQDMIDNEISPWATEELLKTAEAGEGNLIPIWEEMGHTLIYPTPEEEQLWIEAVAPFHDQMVADLEAKGLPGREAYDLIQQLIEKYNKQY